MDVRVRERHPPRAHDTVAGPLTRLRGRFAGFGPAVQDYVHRLERDRQLHCSPIEWVEQGRWTRGRVVLVGDAAHASSPMMGQGGCLAIEDAWVLAEILRAEATVEGALAAYTRRRRPRVTWVHEQSRAIADSFRLPPPVRDCALRERARHAPPPRRPAHPAAVASRWVGWEPVRRRAGRLGCHRNSTSEASRPATAQPASTARSWPARTGAPAACWSARAAASIIGWAGR